MLVSDSHSIVPNWFIPDPLVCCPLNAVFHRTRAMQGVLIQSSFGSHAVENNDLVAEMRNVANMPLHQSSVLLR